MFDGILLILKYFFQNQHLANDLDNLDFWIY